MTLINVLPLASSSWLTTALYLIIAILVFCALICIHELGHYTAARIFKVSIKEFSIGMGKKLVSYTSKKSGIMYALRLFPVGGYVSMVGEDEETDDPNALNKKPAWQRLIILAAGATMNIVLGIILMLLLTTFALNIYGTTVTNFDESYVQTQDDELLQGDKIIKVENTKVHFYQELSYEIMHKGNKPLDITVIRNGETKVLNDVVFPTEEESGTVFGSMFFGVNKLEKTFSNVISYTFYSSFSTIKMIWESLVDLVTGRYGLEAMSGPVGVMNVVAESARSGLPNLIYITVFITMNLGVFNLLPVPALDGCRIVFVLIEIVRGKPINPKYEGYVHLAGMLLLLLLMVVITFKDVFNLIM